MAMTLIKLLTVSSALAFGAHLAFAASVLPEAAVMPWHTGCIVPETAKQAEKALKASRASLEEFWLAKNEPLAGSTTLNAKRIGNSIAFGSLKQKLPVPIAIEPIWCSVADQYVFFVAIVDMKLNTLIGGAHTIISRKDWRVAQQKKEVESLLTDKIIEVSKKAQASIVTGAPENALHVALNVGQETSRADEGSSLCLNLLLSEKLFPRYTMIQSLRGEDMATVRFMLGIDPALRRPTRVIVTRWGFLNRAFPLQLALHATYAESVLGSPIPPSLETKWNLEVSDKTIRFDVDPGIEEFLAAEAKSLSLAAPPKAAKIEGAWVYLDKGRAYGLDMNDRLVSTSDGIKGHVVGFFGADLNLKSSGGGRINEGAILFVRKGQKDVKVGQAFKFDPQKFPAEWQPTK